MLYESKETISLEIREILFHILIGARGEAVEDRLSKIFTSAKTFSAPLLEQ